MKLVDILKEIHLTTSKKVVVRKRTNPDWLSNKEYDLVYPDFEGVYFDEYGPGDYAWEIPKDCVSDELTPSKALDFLNWLKENNIKYLVEEYGEEVGFNECIHKYGLTRENVMEQDPINEIDVNQTQIVLKRNDEKYSTYNFFKPEQFQNVEVWFNEFSDEIWNICFYEENEDQFELFAEYLKSHNIPFTEDEEEEYEDDNENEDFAVPDYTWYIISLNKKYIILI